MRLKIKPEWLLLAAFIILTLPPDAALSGTEHGNAHARSAPGTDSHRMDIRQNTA